MVLQEVKKLPKKNKLGSVMYGNSKYHIYNDKGQAVFYVYNKRIKKYFKMKRHVGSGYMLRKLGIESSAGGTIFRHYSLPKTAFYGKSRSEIIKLQRSV